MGKINKLQIIDFGFAPPEVVSDFKNYQDILLSEAIEKLLNKKDTVRGLYSYKECTNPVSWMVQTTINEDDELLRASLERLDAFVSKYRIDSRSAALELLLYATEPDPIIQDDVGQNYEVLITHDDDSVYEEFNELQDTVAIEKQPIGIMGNRRKRKYTKKAECWKKDKEIKNTARERNKRKYQKKAECLETGKKDMSKQSQSICNYCGKDFPSRASCMIHERIHTGERPYVCTTCDSSFAQKGGLKTHLLIHSDKQYECNHCGQKFTTKRALLEHTRTHTGDRPFKCQWCDRSYVRRSNLAEHITLHTGEMPYKCRFCGRSFRKSCSKTKHEKIHLEDKRHQCVACGKTFVQKYNLDTHVRRRHANKPVVPPTISSPPPSPSPSSSSSETRFDGEQEDAVPDIASYEET